MPYPMWIPYKEMEPETDRFVSQLRENWLEIERWSLLGASTPSPFPFIVVADDGTGDFTTMKDAIDSVAASTRTVIYVKEPVAGSYSSAQIDISSKRLIITSVAPFPRTGYNSPPDNWIQWQSTSSSAFFLTNASTQLTVIGFLFAGSLRFTDSFITALFIGCHSTAVRFNATGELTAYDSAMTLGTAATGTITDFNTTLINCEIQTSGSQTWSELDHTNWQNTYFSLGNDLTLTAETAVNSDRTCFIHGCTFISDNDLIIDGGNWANITFVGNTSQFLTVFGPSRSNYLNALSLTGLRVEMSGNNLEETDVTLNSTKYHATGIYRSVVINTGSGTFDLTLGETAGFTAPTSALTINSDFNVGTVHGLAAWYVTNLVNLPAGADNNKVIATVGATIADAGAGNVFP